MIEPNISFSTDDLLASEEIFKFLGIELIGYELPLKELEKLDMGSKIELFSRITLKEDNDISQNTIKKLIRKYRYNHHFLSIEPRSAGLAAFAARDGRVDAVKLSSESTLKIFNKRYGRRLEETSKIVEIDISCMFNTNLAKYLRPLIRILDAFSKCDLEYLLSFNPYNPMDLRSYKGIQSIGRMIGLTNKQTSPKSLIKRLEINKKKLAGNIPFPGVEVL